MQGASAIRVILINLIVVVVLFALIIAGYFYYTNSTNYVTTQDAQVSGTIVPITVPFTGTITHWYAAVNSTVNQGELLGNQSNSSVFALNPGLSQMIGNNKSMLNKLKDEETVTSPISGTILQNNVAVGQVVEPGQVVAEVVNLGNLNITANILETEIRHVSVGQTVNISIDGIPNTSFKGTVQSIGDTTTSAFSVIPNPDAAQGSYTAVAQRIPVTISLNGGYAGKALVPGMSAVVSIQVNNNNS